MAVADGCSWGVEPRDAAFKSVKLFGDYMRKYQRDIVTLDLAPQYMLRAYLAAHNLIIEGRNEETLFDAGTTTMYTSVRIPLIPFRLAGMVFELAEGPHKWAYVAVALGDCKAYHWSASSKEITEVTAGNRMNISDPKGI